MTLIMKTRKLNRLLQQNGGHPVNFSEMAEVLRELVEANVYVISRKGKILGCSLADPVAAAEHTADFPENKRVSEELNELLNRVSETSGNSNFSVQVGALPAELNDKFRGKVAMIVPVVGGSERLGTLLIIRGNVPFADDDLILAEYGAAVVAMEILRVKADELEDEARSRTAAHVAVASLSYSELEAVEQILEELNDTEGLLVASKIADRVGITRSVIVNALRKLESAGVIETRSLGMKGTYIRILNHRLLGELKKAGV